MPFFIKPMMGPMFNKNESTLQVLEEAKKSVILEDQQNARIRQTMALEEAIFLAGSGMVDTVITDILL
jgi:hypothetical protein